MSIICGGCRKDISPGPGSTISSDSDCPLCGKCLRVVGVTLSAPPGRYEVSSVGGGGGVGGVAGTYIPNEPN